MTPESLKELQELTGAPTICAALDAAIKFTLLHDKVSIQEALQGAS